MRVVTNTKLAQRNRKIATYLFIATLVILVGGFALVNMSLFTGELPSAGIVALQALSLPVAFVMTIYSVRMTNNWARRPYAEEIIPQELKGLSNKSILYNYYHLPARHLLIAPQGIYAIVTRWHGGKFTVKGNKWVTHKGAISRFFSFIRNDGVGDPFEEAERAAMTIRKQLGGTVDVQALVVFTDPTVEIDQEDPTLPVLHLDGKRSPNLTDYLRAQNQRPDKQKRVVLPLTDEQIAAFEQATVR